ncbi:MAG: hypothetical protein RJA63_1712 [Pseudomonadota bacterium]
MSELAQVTPGKAMRGGVPVIFPQFSDRGPLPKHGFARTLVWEKTAARTGDDYAMASLCLKDSEATRAIWPHAFTLELSVGVTSHRLDLELEVCNLGDSALSFTTALHTYLKVKEVEEVQLEGLNGHMYTDCMKNKVQRTDTGVFLAIDQETDRVYHDVKRPLLMRESHSALGINAENMPDVIVWNPWETGIKNFSDMPPKDFRRMLCIEAGAVETPVTLEPGASWWGRQTLVAM